jgi:hypothetical protein
VFASNRFLVTLRNGCEVFEEDGEFVAKVVDGKGNPRIADGKGTAMTVTHALYRTAAGNHGYDQTGGP